MFHCVICRKAFFFLCFMTILFVVFFDRSPNGDIKVMSVASLLDSDKTSVIFRGPRKTGTLMAKTFQPSQKKI